MLDLKLLRHGNAGDNDPNPQADAARLLTPKGQKQARKAAKKLTGKGIDAIFCGPEPRCQQTAAALSLATGVRYTTSQALADGEMDADGLAELLPEEGTVAVIAHGPEVGPTVEAITGAAFGGLKKGGCCELACENDGKLTGQVTDVRRGQ
jgi:phosphohistidine phosphatase SixA